jgi:dihydrofolate reductase
MTAIKVTLAMVMSVDGRSTEGDVPGTAWASAEDQHFFRAMIASHDLIVMGSATYKTVRSALRLDAKKLRVILTRFPGNFAKDIQAGLSFSAETPEELVQRVSNEGYRSLLLVGGPQTNARFFDARLVDEIFVTVEPLLFGSGLPFASPLRRAVNLQLVSSKQLNDRGTLLLQYRVLKSIRKVEQRYVAQ